mmetsp:Transcript_18410/g.42498  ORF Transcript_18410/g.42498 Transcript_18410/m.42498 type:complete len:414 (+) Transcript_18410:187-1428(+)
MFDCPTYKFATGRLPAWRGALYLLSAFTNLFCSIAAFFFVGSVFSRKKVYNNTLNLYVAFLLLPDAANNFVVFVYGIFEVQLCEISGPWRPYYEFMIFFYFFCNFYLNVVVAQEIYSILEQSSRRKKAKPPPLKKGIAQISLIYVLAILLGIWAILDVPWSFFDRGNFGSPDDGAFSELGSFILVGCLIAIPLVYILVICVLIRVKGLLPKDGKTRSVTIFFGRIVVIFFVFYLPGVGVNIYCTTLNQRSARYFWMERLNQVFYILQSVVTMYMVSFKDDIWNAVHSNFRVCTCREPLPGVPKGERSSRRSYWSMRRSSVTTRISAWRQSILSVRTSQSIKTTRFEEKSPAIEMEGTEGAFSTAIEGSAVIDFSDPEPINIIHPNTNDDDDDDDVDDDDEEEEESSIWVGNDL